MRIWKLALMLWGVVMAATAGAQEVHYAFDGVVTQTFAIPNNSFGLSVPSGTPFHGEFFYDATTSPSFTSTNAEGALAQYESGGFWMTIGGIAAYAPASILILDNYYAGFDSFGISAQPPSGTSVAGLPFSVGGFYMALNDSTGLSFSGTALPTVLGPAFNYFNGVGLILKNGADEFQIQGDIVTFRAVAAVPEPSTLLLVLSGLGAMGVVTRRRGRRR